MISGRAKFITSGLSVAAIAATMHMMAGPPADSSEALRYRIEPYADSEIANTTTGYQVRGKSNTLSGVKIEVDPEPGSGTILVRFSLDSTEKLSLRRDHADGTQSWHALRKHNWLALDGSEPTSLILYGQEGYNMDISSLAIEDCIDLQPLECILTPFGDAEIEVSGNRLRAVSPAGSVSGVAITPPASISSERAILRFSIADPGGLSIRRDAPDGSQRWLHANRTNQYVVHRENIPTYVIYGSDIRMLEVLDVSMEPCSRPFSDDCLVPADIRPLFEQDAGFPGYEDSQALLVFLLDWASNKADYALSNSLME